MKIFLLHVPVTPSAHKKMTDDIMPKQGKLLQLTPGCVKPSGFPVTTSSHQGRKQSIGQLTCRAGSAQERVWLQRCRSCPQASQGCTGAGQGMRAAKENKAFSCQNQALKCWSPQLDKGSVGLTLPLPPARHAWFNRAQETGKSQEINVFSLSFLLPVK